MAVFRRFIPLLLTFGVLSLTSCQQTFDAASRPRAFSPSPDPIKDSDPGESPGDPHPPISDVPAPSDPPDEPPGELPEVPGEPLPPSHPMADDSTLSQSLVLWLRSDDLVLGLLEDGDPVGRVGESEWTNYQFAADWTSVSAVGVAYATYLNPGPLGRHPSVLLCGGGDLCTHSKGAQQGTQLRLAESYRTYEMIHGPDSVGECSDCGGSFTIVTLIARASSDSANYLLSHTDGNASAFSGPFFGWIGERTVRFGTQGPKGFNSVDVDMAPYSGSPKHALFLARFSRSEGIQVFLDGQLVAEDFRKTTGSDTTLGLSPILGHRHGQKDYRLHIYEYLEFNKALSAVEQEAIQKYLKDKYR